MQNNRRAGSPAKREGFTLIELMISIALVLILILGINTVFKYTAQAVGQGQAINNAVRDSRSAQTTMSSDFASLVPNGSGATDSASLIIASMAQPAYMNAADKTTADGQTPAGAMTAGSEPLYVDINGDGKKGDTTIPGELVSPATYNFRNHRLDTISFFARNNFPRQTGNDGTYVDNMTSQEAWMWYGHLWLPNNDQSSQTNAFPAIAPAVPSPTYPGVGVSATNPNNVYASQFVLGRMPTLLKIPTAAGIVDSNGAAQVYYPLVVGGLTPPQLYMAPLQYNNTSSTSQNDTWGTGAARTYVLQESRNDLAGTSIKTLQSQIINAIAGSNPTWWVRSTFANLSDVYSDTTSIMRFQANPFPSKPLTAARLATAAPYFIPGCSQFIVEFAGDFTTQDNNPAHIDTGLVGAPHSQMGQIVGNGADGVIDYVVVGGVKQIMWYGLPRNTSGAATTNWANGDVVPVRDFLFENQAAYDPNGTMIAAGTLNSIASFEKVGPTYVPNYTATAGGMPETEAHRGYICAFGPNDPAPSLIRITMTLNDTGGQLPDGQTYQFVFAVRPQ